MSIPSQLPQLIAAARAGALQTLALQPGQMLDGKVIGPAPNGGTQVQIAGQMLNLVLPLAAKAGEMLKFEVQGSGTQVRLAVQPPVAAPAQPGAQPANQPAPLSSQPSNLPLPAVPVPVSSPAAASSPPPSQMPPQGQVSTTVQQQAAQPLPATVTVQSAQVPAAAPQPAQAATVAPPAAAAPTVTAPPTALPAAAAPVVSAAPSPLAAPTLPAVAAAVQPPVSAYPNAAPKATAQPAPVQPLSPTTTTNAPAGGQGRAPSGASISAPPMPAMPSTPQAALAQMVQLALPRQDSVASLMTALTSIAGKVVLPEPVARAAQQVLAGRVAIDGRGIDGAALQKAIMRSGVFQEAILARPGMAAPTPQTDTKTALLALRQTLTTWLGSQAPVAPPSAIPPPIRGHVPRARASDAPPLDPGAAPDEVGRQLLERTESALSRMRLHQGASLPDVAARNADWSMDLPVVIGQHQTVLQMQIHRDQQNAAEADAERGWQMRFALSLPDMGEVGAQVSLRGGATGVMLWAAERPTSEALEAEIETLRSTLAAVGLRPGAVIVRHGEPPAPPAAPSGHVVDASR